MSVTQPRPTDKQVKKAYKMLTAVVEGEVVHDRQIRAAELLIQADKRPRTTPRQGQSGLRLQQG